MASVKYETASPHSSTHDLDSTGDTDDSWQYLDHSSAASVPGSIALLPSPASGSLSGYAIIGHGYSHSHNAASTPSSSQAGLSPGSCMDRDQSLFLPTSTTFQTDDEYVLADQSGFTAATDPFMTPPQYLLPQEFIADLVPFVDDFSADAFTTVDTSPAASQNPQASLRSEMSLPSWDSASPSNVFVLDDTNSPHSSSPVMVSPSARSLSSSSPTARFESSRKSASASPPRMHRVMGSKVEKPLRTPSSSSSSSSAAAAAAAAAGSSQFVIMTPTTIHAHAGKPNPFECFEAMRTTQKGRKGPLAYEIKESALQVRRVGACFCCHSRKVKCDKERPCRHCKKLMLQVPQVVCWQFQDFLPVLFPDFIRGHFKRDVMAEFLQDSIGGFVDGDREVSLSSGPLFATTLTVRAKFFTAKSCDVLQHWHLRPGWDEGTAARLDSNGSVPIGIELKGTYKDELRKQLKTYVQYLTAEAAYAPQVTDAFRTTKLPVKILAIVQAYAEQSDSAMVKRALSIYTMHYVMTRHLCLTRRSILSLSASGVVPQDAPWVTSRVLSRQLKHIVDELIMRETTQLFELFSKSLKPKFRREWAPCLASFLVLCLFMEAVEAAADNFVLSQAEIQDSARISRSLVLDTCKGLENMPFKQFAYQFHHLYQTHSKDANMRSFNPLLDGSCLDGGELDGPAVEMIRGLRELFHGEEWQDLQFFADDDMILHRDEHPDLMDRSFIYTGRLVAKFLLSFTNESIIFGSQI